MKRVLVGVFLSCAAPAVGQVPAARLAPPVAPPAPPVTRAASPDPFPDGQPLPAARLGPITSARIGEVPDDASPEERYNWGEPRNRDRRVTPASRTRETDRDRDRLGESDRDYDRDSDRDRGRDRDRDDRDRRGARLREPAPGRLTSGGRRGGDEPPPPSPGGPADPNWWPGREQDLNELRGQFPAFGERNRDHLAFGSDCDFDDFVSPISNPFLAEDPRSLTELRPIFLWQTIPGTQYLYHGGNITFFGTQARVSFSDRFSVVMHKLGGLSINPGGSSFVPGETGMAEIWLGPKFTFWRDPDAQTIAAAGLQFQLPIGSSGVFQNTGNLGLVPYVSYGRCLGETNWGRVNLIDVAGYHFGTNGGRSEYLFNTLHFDLDAADYHRFYPVLELSWFHYTTNGRERP
ncbi:MAG TPA: hypothetical protein VKE74_33315, partial [Gemmataceae bacterium]|nr:hypothetical protein [Gemmataceae bacterium]